MHAGGKIGGRASAIKVHARVQKRQEDEERADQLEAEKEEEADDEVEEDAMVA